MSALSGFLVERSEHRILGGLGVMAVQVFSRIRLRANVLAGVLWDGALGTGYQAA
jgi:hypothetical protein